ncbi:hypothetical protein ACF3NT_11535 [Naumannella halotolerans]|uniref:hypothetical protein n=1 Tax=Naumannella halotolerans TaxID=993414 RepID=UPI00370D904B
MTMKKRRKPITAQELIEQIAADPELLAKLRDQENYHQEKAAEYSAEERPVVEKIRAAGVNVDSVWDLVNTDVPYPSALPILVSELESGQYSDRLREGIARALAVKPAVRYWTTLKGLLKSARGPDESAGLAAAVVACAHEEHVDELIEMINDKTLGDNRILFIGPVATLGGKRGREAVRDAARRDPVLRQEARSALD